MKSLAGQNVYIKYLLNGSDWTTSSFLLQWFPLSEIILYVFYLSYCEYEHVFCKKLFCIHYLFHCDCNKLKNLLYVDVTCWFEVTAGEKNSSGLTTPFHLETFYNTIRFNTTCLFVLAFSFSEIINSWLISLWHGWGYHLSKLWGLSPPCLEQPDKSNGSLCFICITVRLVSTFRVSVFIQRYLMLERK